MNIKTTGVETRYGHLHAICQNCSGLDHSMFLTNRDQHRCCGCGSTPNRISYFDNARKQPTGCTRIALEKLK